MSLSPEEQALKDAAIKAEQLDFISSCRELASKIDEVFGEARKLREEYTDKRFNTGNSNQIIEASLVNVAPNLSDLTAFMELLQQLKNFANNNSVAQANYWQVVNQIKQ